jgi:SAM-dependent methyltransferase
MNPSFVSLLMCPACKGDLALEVESNAGSAVQSGNLSCSQGHSYPIVRGIPRFVSSDGYAANFGFEWNLHNRTQLDTENQRESEQTLMEKTGFTSGDFRGKLVLDVGCGMGRFADVASRWGATVVGVDLTSAIDAASGNIGDRDNVHLAQADVFRLPLRDGTFDFVFSIGVLHHTPNTRDAFDRLPALLKPGGRVAIWVYSSSMRSWSRTSDAYRVVTTRLPKRLLYAMSHIAVPWYHLSRLPAVGPRLAMVLPIRNHPNPAWRVLDTFDWYSPRYQWKHSDSEVREWFESQGLVELKQLPFPTSIQGKRPASAAVSSGGV